MPTVPASFLRFCAVLVLLVTPVAAISMNLFKRGRRMPPKLRQWYGVHVWLPSNPMRRPLTGDRRNRLRGPATPAADSV